MTKVSNLFMLCLLGVGFGLHIIVEGLWWNSNGHLLGGSTVTIVAVLAAVLVRISEEEENDK